MAPLKGLLATQNKITAPLVTGGMGEVYRAWDTRLEHTVAVARVEVKWYTAAS